jgi:uncharacterized membrane protein YccF (DUF307 family)
MIRHISVLVFLLGMSFLQQLTFMLAVILATIFIISLVFNQTMIYYRILEKARKFGKKTQIRKQTAGL